MKVSVVVVGMVLALLAIGIVIMGTQNVPAMIIPDLPEALQELPGTILLITFPVTLVRVAFGAAAFVAGGIKFFASLRSLRRTAPRHALTRSLFFEHLKRGR